MFRPGAQFILLVLLVGLALMRESRQEPTRQIDEQFADFLARNSPRSEAPAPLTLVEINEGSLKGHAWPWTPLDFALFFQAANNFQPEVLATDELLRWDERNATGELRQKLPQYKTFLREHMLRARKVLLGARLGYPDDPHVIPPLEEVPVIRNVRGDVSRIPEFTTIAVQPEDEFGLSSVSGFTNLQGGNVEYQSVPLILRYRGQVVPSFVLQAILLWEKLTPDEVAVDAGRHVTLAGQLEIPIDALGRMRVDFGVPRQRCSFDELILASARRDAERQTKQRVEMNIPVDLIDGKMLLLARTDPAAQTLHFAAQRRGSAGELFGAAIATIQNRSFIHRAPFWLEVVILAVVMIASWWVPCLRRRTMLIIGPLGLIVYVMFAMLVLGSTLMWLPLVLPAGLIALLMLFRCVTPGIAATQNPPP